MSIDLSLMMFAENELSQVLIYDPLMWRYVAAFSYFLVPVFLSWVLWGWLKHNRPYIVLPALLSSVAFVGITACLSIFTDFSFINAYPPFDMFFITVVLLLLIFCAKPLTEIGLQGQVVVFSIVTLFLSLVIDMLSAHGFIAWVDKAGQWGLVLFAISSLSIYLIKDWRQQVVLSILTNTLELQVEERTKELQESKRKLEKLAREDFLTGLLNRRAFMEQAAKEVANAVRHKRPLSLVLFDIDFFKTVNDEYGHATGDEVLRKLSAVTKKQCREGDLVCRYGGEEFVILLHATLPEDAENLVKRLQCLINQLVISPSKNVNITVTASFGLVSLVEDGHSVGDAERLLARLLNSADDAMYNVKRGGRNGIETCVLQGNQNKESSKSA
jgi:diguanylate cyclase (GGDEF)-like protein